MDGLANFGSGKEATSLEKDQVSQIAAVNAFSAAALEHSHPTLTSHTTAEQSEKTAAGKVIGTAWDLVAGQASAALVRGERAAKADQYAEIAADTFASIPKFGALTGGLARSVFLLDVSGQKSAAEVARGMAYNFVEGAALNSVSRLATSESAVGRLVTNRLGAGLTAEIATHSIAAGGYGLVKSGMSAQSWQDRQGHLSMSDGLKNIAIGTGTGALIGVPAGMAGLRVGRAVTFGLGSQVEHSAVAAVVQKVATGAGSGFASGSVFGGVDAVRSGQSLSQVLSSSWQGGVVGLATGALSSGIDTRSGRGIGQSNDHLTASDAAALRPAEQIGQREHAREDAEAPREFGKISLTDQLIERSDHLGTNEERNRAFERFAYTAKSRARIEEFAPRLSEPTIVERTQSRLRDDAPQSYGEMREAMAANRAGKPLDFHEHFWAPYVEQVRVPMRIHSVEGHAAKIILPESYAQQLDEVRTLRRENDRPSPYTRLGFAEKGEVAKIMASGDASGLTKFMTQSEATDYIKIYQAAQKLKVHPLAARALPEDVVYMLDLLPNRSLVKDITLQDGPNIGNAFSAIEYGAPGFKAAATVGPTGSISFFQANHDGRFYTNGFHEWSHLAKWADPTFSKLFDLSSMVDRVATNVDHQATYDKRLTEPRHEQIQKPGRYYPDLHSTRSQDENFAVGLGDEILNPDPTSLFRFLDEAPVRSLTLASALEAQVKLAGTNNRSVVATNILDRADYATDLVKPFALGQVQDRLANGSPTEKAAAAQLMVHFGTTEQSPDLLAQAVHVDNHVVPEWQGTLAESSMQGDLRTVSQHAFDAYLALNHHTESQRIDAAMKMVVQQPEYKKAGLDYLARSADPRARDLVLMAKLANSSGTLVEKAIAVNLIKQFGGDNRSERLLAMALDKGNREMPNFRSMRLTSDWHPNVTNTISNQLSSSGLMTELGGSRSVAQRAYDAYVDVTAHSHDQRGRFAFEQGLQKPNQREMAANYLINSYSTRSQAYGNFLAVHDLPGHVAMMQNLIEGGLRGEPAGQRLVFDRMMQLTDVDPRRQMEFVAQNLSKVPSLREAALNKIDSIISRGPTSQQRRQIGEAFDSAMHGRGLPQPVLERIEALTKRLDQDAKIEEAIMLMRRSQSNQILGVHELSTLHDQRAIKPLLQQAVSSNVSVAQEAIGALQQYSPALVKYYAQELKREYFANPTMTGKISDLLTSHRLSASPQIQ